MKIRTVGADWQTDGHDETNSVLAILPKRLTNILSSITRDSGIHFTLSRDLQWDFSGWASLAVLWCFILNFQEKLVTKHTNVNCLSSWPQELHHCFNKNFSIIYALIFSVFCLTFWSLVITWCSSRFNIQQLYALPTLYLCVLHLSEKKQRLVSHHKLVGFYNRDEKCLLRGRDWILNKAFCHSSLKG